MRNRPRSAVISAPIASISGGASSGPARLIHTQPPHSSAATAGERTPSRSAGSKSSRSGTPTTSAGRVVHPAVVRAGEPLAPHPASSPTIAGPRCWHTLWNAASEPSGWRVTTTVSPWPSKVSQSPVSATCSDRPARIQCVAEHPLAFELEADRVGVHVAVHRARPVIGHLLDARAQPNRNITSCRNMDHVDRSALVGCVALRVGEAERFTSPLAIYNRCDILRQCRRSSMPSIADDRTRRGGRPRDRPFRRSMGPRCATSPPRPDGHRHARRTTSPTNASCWRSRSRRRSSGAAPSAPTAPASPPRRTARHADRRAPDHRRHETALDRHARASAHAENDPPRLDPTRGLPRVPPYLVELLSGDAPTSATQGSRTPDRARRRHRTPGAVRSRAWPANDRCAHSRSGSAPRVVLMIDPVPRTAPTTSCCPTSRSPDHPLDDRIGPPAPPASRGSDCSRPVPRPLLADGGGDGQVHELLDDADVCLVEVEALSGWGAASPTDHYLAFERGRVGRGRRGSAPRTSRRSARSTGRAQRGRGPVRRLLRSSRRSRCTSSASSSSRSRTSSTPRMRWRSSKAPTGRTVACASTSGTTPRSERPRSDPRDPGRTDRRRADERRTTNAHARRLQGRLPSAPCSPGARRLRLVGFVRRSSTWVSIVRGTSRSAAPTPGGPAHDHVTACAEAMRSVLTEARHVHDAPGTSSSAT